MMGNEIANTAAGQGRSFRPVQPQRGGVSVRSPALLVARDGGWTP